mgnify:CR=1 FL=1|tara:strand:- start:291 stop:731 length:441 start_codon:yes stop_codon:yes gene_type:complete
MKFDKIYGSNIYFRVVQLLVSSLPLIFVTVNLATNNSTELNMKGFATFFILYFCFAYIYWRFNVFDWDVYLSSNEIMLKNLISTKVYDRSQGLEIEKVPFLSFVAKVYCLRLKGEKFHFKVIKGYSFLNRLFQQNQIVKELNEKLN